MHEGSSRNPDLQPRQLSSVKESPGRKLIYYQFDEAAGVWKRRTERESVVDSAGVVSTQVSAKK